MGAEINFSENVSLPDAEPALRDFSNKGYNLIFAHSMEYGESVTKIAGDYPDTKYAVYTGTVEADNVASISLNEHETGYLAGMLAASMSKTGKIGVIIGSDLPPMIRIAEAYKLGAKEVNPDIQVFDVFAGSWDDIAKGKEAALGQIEMAPTLSSMLRIRLDWERFRRRRKKACMQLARLWIRVQWHPEPYCPVPWIMRIRPI